MELDSDIVISCDLKLIGNKGVWNMSRICKVMGGGDLENEWRWGF
jgi:hypothetical protein